MTISTKLQSRDIIKSFTRGHDIVLPGLRVVFLYREVKWIYFTQLRYSILGSQALIFSNEICDETFATTLCSSAEREC